MARVELADLTALYPVLSILSIYISQLDLYHISRTCKACHSYVAPGSDLFTALCRESLCDGRGLQARKTFRAPLYERRNVRHKRYDGTWERPMIHFDEPIEICLDAKQCDQSDVLPCLKCGINICEECRVLDRASLADGWLPRLPFPHPNGEDSNFYALCSICDIETEAQLKGKHWSANCDCDAWDRWVCIKCAEAEVRFDEDCPTHAGGEGDQEETKVVDVHQMSFSVRVPCLRGLS